MRFFSLSLSGFYVYRARFRQLIKFVIRHTVLRAAAKRKRDKLHTHSRNFLAQLINGMNKKAATVEKRTRAEMKQERGRAREHNRIQL